MNRGKILESSKNELLGMGEAAGSANLGKSTKIYLIGQTIKVDNVAHHPNRLVEGAEFVISATTINDIIRRDEVKATMSCSVNYSKVKTVF